MMTAEQPVPRRVAEMEAEFRAWRRDHPESTLTELEIELDRRLRTIRAQMLSEAAGDHATEAPPCRNCGQPLVASGARSRTVVTQGEQPLTLTRPYRRCPACGAGLFPPR